MDRLRMALPPMGRQHVVQRMTVYETTITEITVCPHGKSPVYAESATHVRMEDEGGGAFIVLEQNDQKVCLDPEELPLVLAAAQKLLNQPIGKSTD